MKFNNDKKVSWLDNDKILIFVVFVIVIFVFFICVRISTVISDIKKDLETKEDPGYVSLYTTNIFIRPFNAIANKYTITYRKKISIMFEHNKQDITNAEKRSCYIFTTKRPNIFLQRYLSEDDYLAINVKIGAIIKDQGFDLKLNSILDLIDFVERRKMKIIVNGNDNDIKNTIINWYKRYITSNVCSSIINKIVPLNQLSINDISDKNIIATISDKNSYDKNTAQLYGITFFMNDVIDVSKVIDYLYRKIGLIFVAINEFSEIKNHIKNGCESYYLNNNFTKTLDSIESKNISETGLRNNEVAIGLFNDVVNNGKLIYSSSNNEDMTIWLIASGHDKKMCYNFFAFVKKNNMLLNKYSLVLV